MPEEYHILGDAAYPLSSSLLTPFKGKQLPEDKDHYNYSPSKNCVTIKPTFALLKGRWRKLKLVDMSVDRIPSLISAYCILHNICLLNNDLIDPDSLEGDINM